MSWSFTAHGSNKTETLKAFDKECDNAAPYATPGYALKKMARVAVDHMREQSVTMITCSGHTNPDGLGCNVRLAVNAY